MAYSNPQEGNAPASVMLGPQIEIFPSMPLPELNAAGGPAFAARYKSDAASSLYAIVCLSGLPPRTELVHAMRMIDNPGVLRMVDAGVIAWTGGARAYAIVYQRPSVPPMMNTLDETRQALGEDAVNHHFIAPMINALVALSSFGVVHNAIRPNNIFWRIGNAAAPQLGECLSAPAGIGQPIMFEPIERALAMPIGRGTGIPADDCYAFGVALAFLVGGRNPLQGMDDAAVIDLKMQRGSFSALVGSQRLSPTHIEILRGLLADDPRQRWTATDLDQWLNGRRMTPKSSDAGRRAGRHFEFMGKEYWQAGALGVSLAANVEEAAKVIENESLHKWLRRAMSDDDRAADVETVVNDLKQTGRTLHYEDQLVARVCIALDPRAPIRYRGIAAMPSGIPALVAEAMLNNTNLATLSEIISTQLVTLWLEMQKEIKGEHIATSQLFERMKGLIERASFGNGIERVAYEANPELPCLSPMLRDQYVVSPKVLLSALERVASSGNRPKEPIDRHIAAFLIVRDKRGEALFTALSAPDGSAGRNLALLSLFSEMQYRHGPESLPQLTSWLAPLAEPLLRRFLSKNLRDALQKQAREATANGNLVLLVRLVDEPRRTERDRQDFIAARILYLNIQKEIGALEARLANRDSVVHGAGKQTAASISSFLAIILICAAVLRAFLEALLQ